MINFLNKITISEVLVQNLFNLLSQASFVSSGNRTDISLDDPNFWQKWAKIAELEIDSKEEKVKMPVGHLFLSEKCLTVPTFGQRISPRAFLWEGLREGTERRKSHYLNKLISSSSSKYKIAVIHASLCQ